MKEFKGTPGYWIYSLVTGEVIATNHGVVADLFCDGLEDINGMLIAGAPRLLEAIQHLVEVYDSEDGKQYTTTSKREALAKAREAIDLALGD